MQMNFRMQAMQALAFFFYFAVWPIFTPGVKAGIIEIIQDVTLGGKGENNAFYFAYGYSGKVSTIFPISQYGYSYFCINVDRAGADYTISPGGDYSLSTAPFYGDTNKFEGTKKDMECFYVEPIATSGLKPLFLLTYSGSLKGDDKTTVYSTNIRVEDYSLSSRFFELDFEFHLSDFSIDGEVTLIFKGVNLNPFFTFDYSSFWLFKSKTTQLINFEDPSPIESFAVFKENKKWLKDLTPLSFSSPFMQTDFGKVPVPEKSKGIASFKGKFSFQGIEIPIIMDNQDDNLQGHFKIRQPATLFQNVEFYRGVPGFSLLRLSAFPVGFVDPEKANRFEWKALPFIKLPRKQEVPGLKERVVGFGVHSMFISGFNAASLDDCFSEIESKMSSRKFLLPFSDDCSVDSQSARNWFGFEEVSNSTHQYLNWQTALFGPMPGGDGTESFAFYVLTQNINFRITAFWTKSSGETSIIEADESHPCLPDISVVDYECWNTPILEVKREAGDLLEIRTLSQTQETADNQPGLFTLRAKVTHDSIEFDESPSRYLTVSVKIETSSPQTTILSFYLNYHIYSVEIANFCSKLYSLYADLDSSVVMYRDDPTISCFFVFLKLFDIGKVEVTNYDKDSNDKIVASYDKHPPEDKKDVIYFEVFPKNLLFSTDHSRKNSREIEWAERNGYPSFSQKTRPREDGVDYFSDLTYFSDQNLLENTFEKSSKTMKVSFDLDSIPSSNKRKFKNNEDFVVQFYEGAEYSAKAEWSDGSERANISFSLAGMRTERVLLSTGIVPFYLFHKPTPDRKVLLTNSKVKFDSPFFVYSDQEVFSKAENTVTLGFKFVWTSNTDKLTALLKDSDDNTVAQIEEKNVAIAAYKADETIPRPVVQLKLPFSVFSDHLYDSSYTGHSEYFLHVWFSDSFSDKGLFPITFSEVPSADLPYFDKPAIADQEFEIGEADNIIQMINFSPLPSEHTMILLNSLDPSVDSFTSCIVSDGSLTIDCYFNNYAPGEYKFLSYILYGELNQKVYSEPYSFSISLKIEEFDSPYLLANRNNDVVITGCCFSSKTALYKNSTGQTSPMDPIVVNVRSKDQLGFSINPGAEESVCVFLEKSGFKSETKCIPAISKLFLNQEETNLIYLKDYDETSVKTLAFIFADSPESPSFKFAKSNQCDEVYFEFLDDERTVLLFKKPGIDQLFKVNSTIFENIFSESLEGDVRLVCKGEFVRYVFLTEEKEEPEFRIVLMPQLYFSDYIGGKSMMEFNFKIWPKKKDQPMINEFSLKNYEGILQRYEEKQASLMYRVVPKANEDDEDSLESMKCELLYKGLSIPEEFPNYDTVFDFSIKIFDSTTTQLYYSANDIQFYPEQAGGKNYFFKLFFGIHIREQTLKTIKIYRMTDYLEMDIGDYIDDSQVNIILPLTSNLGFSQTYSTKYFAEIKKEKFGDALLGVTSILIEPYIFTDISKTLLKNTTMDDLAEMSYNVDFINLEHNTVVCKVCGFSCLNVKSQDRKLTFNLPMIYTKATEVGDLKAHLTIETRNSEGLVIHQFCGESELKATRSNLVKKGADNACLIKVVIEEKTLLFLGALKAFAISNGAIAVDVTYQTSSGAKTTQRVTSSPTNPEPFSDYYFDLLGQMNSLIFLEVKEVTESESESCFIQGLVVKGYFKYDTTNTMLECPIETTIDNREMDFNTEITFRENFGQFCIVKDAEIQLSPKTNDKNAAIILNISGESFDHCKLENGKVFVYFGSSESREAQITNQDHTSLQLNIETATRVPYVHKNQIYVEFHGEKHLFNSVKLSGSLDTYALDGNTEVELVDDDNMSIQNSITKFKSLKMFNSSVLTLTDYYFSVTDLKLSDDSIITITTKTSLTTDISYTLGVSNTAVIAKNAKILMNYLDSSYLNFFKTISFKNGNQIEVETGITDTEKRQKVVNAFKKQDIYVYYAADQRLETMKLTVTSVNYFSTKTSFEINIDPASLTTEIKTGLEATNTFASLDIQKQVFIGFKLPLKITFGTSESVATALTIKDNGAFKVYSGAVEVYGPSFFANEASIYFENSYIKLAKTCTIRNKETSFKKSMITSSITATILSIDGTARSGGVTVSVEDSIYFGSKLPSHKPFEVKDFTKTFLKVTGCYICYGDTAISGKLMDFDKNDDKTAIWVKNTFIQAFTTGFYTEATSKTDTFDYKGIVVPDIDKVLQLSYTTFYLVETGVSLNTYHNVLISNCKFVDGKNVVKYNKGFYYFKLQDSFVKKLTSVVQYARSSRKSLNAEIINSSIKEFSTAVVEFPSNSNGFVILKVDEKSTLQPGETAVSLISGEISEAQVFMAKVGTNWYIDQAFGYIAGNPNCTFNEVYNNYECPEALVDFTIGIFDFDLLSSQGQVDDVELTLLYEELITDSKLEEDMSELAKSNLIPDPDDSSQYFGVIDTKSTLRMYLKSTILFWGFNLTLGIAQMFSTDSEFSLKFHSYNNFDWTIKLAGDEVEFEKTVNFWDFPEAGVYCIFGLKNGKTNGDINSLNQVKYFMETTLKSSKDTAVYRQISFTHEACLVSKGCYIQIINTETEPTAIDDPDTWPEGYSPADDTAFLQVGYRVISGEEESISFNNFIIDGIIDVSPKKDLVFEFCNLWVRSGVLTFSAKEANIHLKIKCTKELKNPYDQNMGMGMIIVNGYIYFEDTKEVVSSDILAATGQSIKVSNDFLNSVQVGDEVLLTRYEVDQTIKATIASKSSASSTLSLSFSVESTSISADWVTKRTAGQQSGVSLVEGGCVFTIPNKITISVSEENTIENVKATLLVTDYTDSIGFYREGVADISGVLFNDVVFDSKNIVGYFSASKIQKSMFYMSKRHGINLNNVNSFEIADNVVVNPMILGIAAERVDDVKITNNFVINVRQKEETKDPTIGIAIVDFQGSSLKVKGNFILSADQYCLVAPLEDCNAPQGTSETINISENYMMNCKCIGMVLESTQFHECNKVHDNFIGFSKKVGMYVHSKGNELQIIHNKMHKLASLIGYVESIKSKIPGIDVTISLNDFDVSENRNQPVFYHGPSVSNNDLPEFVLSNRCSIEQDSSKPWFVDTDLSESVANSFAKVYIKENSYTDSQKTLGVEVFGNSQFYNDFMMEDQMSISLTIDKEVPIVAKSSKETESYTGQLSLDSKCMEDDSALKCSKNLASLQVTNALSTVETEKGVSDVEIGMRFDGVSVETQSQNEVQSFKKVVISKEEHTLKLEGIPLMIVLAMESLSSSLESVEVILNIELTENRFLIFTNNITGSTIQTTPQIKNFTNSTSALNGCGDHFFDQKSMMYTVKLIHVQGAASGCYLVIRPQNSLFIDFKLKFFPDPDLEALIKKEERDDVIKSSIAEITGTKESQISIVFLQKGSLEIGFVFSSNLNQNEEILADLQDFSGKFKENAYEFSLKELSNDVEITSSYILETTLLVNVAQIMNNNVEIDEPTVSTVTQTTFGKKNNNPYENLFPEGNEDKPTSDASDSNATSSSDDSGDNNSDSGDIDDGEGTNWTNIVIIVVIAVVIIGLIAAGVTGGVVMRLKKGGSGGSSKGGRRRMPMQKRSVNIEMRRKFTK